MIQDKRPVAVPVIDSKADISEDDRHSLLFSIQTLAPNHDARLQAIQASISSSMLLQFTHHELRYCGSRVFEM